ncbi:hypothetical protein DRQ50_08555 [bacterium]|nr:MAG: hypothetical protein DRQ50_08555 [bacterium]
MHRRITITLVLMALLGLALTAMATEPATTEQGSASPSQVTRERINQIRANEFFYQSFGKDDPFKVLVSGDYEQGNAAEQVDINSATLVGVMWGQDDRFALVENGDGFGYILRVGDRVQHGRVVSIRKNSITARITLYGISNRVVLKLEETED